MRAANENDTGFDYSTIAYVSAMSRMSPDHRVLVLAMNAREVMLSEAEMHEVMSAGIRAVRKRALSQIQACLEYCAQNHKKRLERIEAGVRNNNHQAWLARVDTVIAHFRREGLHDYADSFAALSLLTTAEAAEVLGIEVEHSPADAAE